ncbi:MAG: alanine racemase [Candidatus Zixiibacteriota bacterium]
MTNGSLGFLIQAAELFKHRSTRLDTSELKPFVKSFQDRKDLFLQLAANEGSPLYVIDTGMLKLKANQFRKAFTLHLPRTQFFYALKSNSHPSIISGLVNEGFGLDVSSGIELKTAINAKAQKIIFSGPGKQADELELAVQNNEKVTVLIDSFNELQKLEKVAAHLQRHIQAGIRITTDESGIWKKFGIPLNHVQEFFDESQRCKFVSLCGLQFHISWNLNPEAQVIFIANLGTALKRMNKKFRDKIQFIDIGGGFWPEAGEWLQFAATPPGILQNALAKSEIRSLEHFKEPASPLSSFVEKISIALGNHVPSDMHYVTYVEPGRWLCNDAMHILLTVVDVKSNDLVITDGGTNAIGWERFEIDYFPVINLTRPSLQEKECLIAGSLCTPHDLWGYSYFGNGIKEGDVLLIPNQGAYTFSLRQEFIKPLPKSVVMPDDPGAKNINLGKSRIGNMAK